jgi:hypothetical protein
LYSDRIHIILTTNSRMLRAIGVIIAIISAVVIFVVLKEVFRIVRDNGGLNVSGEYGSIEINDKDFVLSE